MAIPTTSASPVLSPPRRSSRSASLCTLQKYFSTTQRMMGTELTNKWDISKSGTFPKTGSWISQIYYVQFSLRGDGCSHVSCRASAGIKVCHSLAKTSIWLWVFKEWVECDGAKGRTHRSANLCDIYYIHYFQLPAPLMSTSNANRCTSDRQLWLNLTELLDNVDFLQYMNACNEHSTDTDF